MPRPGTACRPGIRWYSIEGISPASTSPAASRAAQAEGVSRKTSTPGGGSWSRPQVRGRAFRKSTTEMRSKRTDVSVQRQPDSSAGLVWLTAASCD